MAVSITFNHVIGDTVTVTASSTTAHVIAMTVDSHNNPLYVCWYVDPVTGFTEQSTFTEAQIT